MSSDMLKKIARAKRMKSSRNADIWSSRLEAQATAVANGTYTTPRGPRSVIVLSPLLPTPEAIRDLAGLEFAPEVYESAEAPPSFPSFPSYSMPPSDDSGDSRTGYRAGSQTDSQEVSREASQEHSRVDVSKVDDSKIASSASLRKVRFCALEWDDWKKLAPKVAEWTYLDVSRGKLDWHNDVVVAKEAVKLKPTPSTEDSGSSCMVESNGSSMSTEPDLMLGGYRTQSPILESVG